MLGIVKRMRERFRVGTLLDMYASRGAYHAHQYFGYLEATRRLPRTPVYRAMAKLVEVDCLLDKNQFDRASDAARILIEIEMPKIDSSDDREYLHLLAEFSFHMRRYYPKWLNFQARPHSFDPEKLDFFLRKKITIQTEPVAVPDDGSDTPPPDANNA